MLNSRIRIKKKRDEDLESAGDLRVHERERYGDEVEKRRNRAAASFTRPTDRRSNLIARALG
jgi:hypothetical protein